MVKKKKRGSGAWRKKWKISVSLLINNYCYFREGKMPSSLLTIYQVMFGLTLEGKYPSTFGHVIFWIPYSKYSLCSGSFMEELKQLPFWTTSRGNATLLQYVVFLKREICNERAISFAFDLMQQTLKWAKWSNAMHWDLIYMCEFI